MKILKINIKGTVSKVFFSNNTFVIVGVKDSNHNEHKYFRFKGFCQTPLKAGDSVLITRGYFKDSDYGAQIEKGTMIVVNEVQQGKSPLVHDVVVPNHTVEINHNMPKKFELTREQQNCIIAAQAQKDLKIKAYAGTGKTSTLVEIAKRLSGKGLYLAYNKAIQIDAVQKFPANVDCKTAHSLAYGYFYDYIQDRIETLNPLTILSHVDMRATGGMQPYELAFLVIKVLRLFCNSGNSVIDGSITDHSEFEAYKGENENKDVLNYIVEKAKSYWDKAVADNATVPIEHDFYLKMYQLVKPNLGHRYHYLLFDECQDANPVIIDIILNQGCQKICVGDEHQQIYSWRGAVNAYDKFDGESYYLSQSFRFGERIANLASAILYLKKEKISLKGNADINSVISSDKPSIYTYLCRTNAGLISRLIDNIKKKLHVVGGIHEVIELAKSGFALYQGNNEEVRHNKIRGFKNWDALKKFKEDFEDPDITFLVNIIDRYGDHFDEVIKQIENAKYVSENNANIIFSTIHKSKGREWDNVVIGDDFTLFTKDDGMQELLKEQSEEFNLLYVAITRTKYKLCLEKDADKFMKRVQAYVEPIIASLPKEEVKPHPKPIVDSLNEVHDDGLPF
ncbi:UvrD-helicase domain-containing protein [Cysteiniphilum halobium]|uniref:UvrD-helicase domain-containing protein n=1 Tax=Cysteiniphilum halobium TaxID=2219059 RepID=UPI000E6493F1|nr:UvrD-helicase domain-containing protein [Cysteiniphilum halobium]